MRVAIRDAPFLSRSTPESGAITVNRVNALYSSNPSDYRKYTLQEAARKKTPTETTAVALSDRVTLSPEAIRQAARPSTPLEDQIMHLRSANAGIYDRRSLRFRR